MSIIFWITVNPSSMSDMTSQPQPKVIHLPKVRMLNRGRGASSTIRITNVKSIKPPDPDIIKKQEEEKLRAQVCFYLFQRSFKYISYCSVNILC